MDIVDAEIVEDPCQCECATCTAGRHCDRASCAQADQMALVEDWRRATVVDGEVLDTEWADSYSASGATQLGAGGRHARWVDSQQASNTVRVVPTGKECWWRLYSTTDSPLRARTQDHGVRDTVAYADQPHCLTLVFDNGTMDVVAMEFKVNPTEDPGAPGPRAIEHKGCLAVAMRGPASIDILSEYPPTLPGYPRHWQQLTLPGEFKHPGNNRTNWRFSDKDWTYNPYYGFGDPHREHTDAQQIPPRGYGIRAKDVQRTTPTDLKALRGGQ